MHATINNEKRLDRLQKRNKENLGNGELSKVEYSDGARRLPRHSDQSRTMPTAKAESVADDAGIIQTFIQPGSKSQGELGLPTKRIIPQNSADRLVEKIIELDDAEKIGNMLRKTIISKDISTKTKLAAINAAKRRLVAITAKNTQKDDKKQK